MKKNNTFFFGPESLNPSMEGDLTVYDICSCEGKKKINVLVRNTIKMSNVNVT